MSSVCLSYSVRSACVRMNISKVNCFLLHFLFCLLLLCNSSLVRNDFVTESTSERVHLNSLSFFGPEPEQSIMLLYWYEAAVTAVQWWWCDDVSSTFWSMFECAAWLLHCDLGFLLIRADCTAHSAAHAANQRWTQQTHGAVDHLHAGFPFKDNSYCGHVYNPAEYMLVQEWRRFKQRCFILLSMNHVETFLIKYKLILMFDM